jgi:hypothetical protein
MELGGGLHGPAARTWPWPADCRGLASTASDKDSLIHFSNPPLGSDQPPMLRDPPLLLPSCPSYNCHLIAARARLLLLAAALLLVSPGPPESRPPVQ